MVEEEEGEDGEANFPFPVRWPAMWGREEKLSRGPTKGVGANADLVVFPASIDVV